MYSRLEPLLFALLAGVVMLAPVPLGSNRPWSSGLLQAVLFCALALVLVVVLRNARRRPWLDRWRESRAVMLLLAAWLAVMAGQLLPGGSALQIGATGAHSAASLYAQAPQLNGDGVRGWSAPATVDVGTTLSSLLKYGSYVAALALALLLARTRTRIVVLAALVVAICTLQSIYGIAVYVAGDTLQWWDPRFSPEGVAGTYVNQNHFAGLIVIGIGLALGMLGAVPLRSRRRGLHGLIEYALAWLQGPSSLLTFALLCMSGALVLSASRGALAALLGMSVAGFFLARKRTGVGAALPTPLLLVVLLGLGGAWLGGYDLVRKLDAQGLGSNRLELAATTVELARHNVITGSGAGTFRWQFPAVRAPELGSSFYQHAHNDWLEMVVDVGVPGAAMLALALTLAFWRILGGLRQRHDRAARGLLAGCLVACGAFVVHALVDFNFNIPANAVIFFIVLGLGLNVASREAFAAHEREPYKNYGRRH